MALSSCALACWLGSLKILMVFTVLACLKILMVNFLDEPRLSQTKHIVQSFKIAMPVLKALAAIRRFIQPVALHHCAHGPVDYEDAFAQEALKCLDFIRSSFHVRC